MGQVFLMGITVNDLREIVNEAVVRANLNLKSEKPQQTSIEQYLSRSEVAKLLKISLVTLNEWTKIGYIKSYRISNRVLYCPDDVKSSLKEVKSLKYRRGVNHSS